MANRYEVSPPSGVYVSEISLPQHAVLFIAANEGTIPKTLRVSWAPCVNVRAQLHGDSSIQDSLTAFWTLTPDRCTISRSLLFDLMQFSVAHPKYWHWGVCGQISSQRFRWSVIWSLKKKLLLRKKTCCQNVGQSGNLKWRSRQGSTGHSHHTLQLM